MLDPALKRFLSLLLAPLFLLLKSKLGVEIPESVQDLMFVSIITYVGGSHAKEAVVKAAEAKGAAAAAVMPKVEGAAVLARAAAEGAKIEEGAQ